MSYLDVKRVLLIAVFFCLAPLGGLEAQERSDQERTPRYYAGALGFAYFESAEDGLNGQTAGGGGVLGVFVSPRFDLAGEVAVPAFFRDGGTQHRDISFSFLFGWHPRPSDTVDVALLAGPAFLRSETRSQLGDFVSSTLALTLGLDLRIRLGESVVLVPQGRGHVALGAFIFRTGISMQLVF